MKPYFLTVLISSVLVGFLIPEPGTAQTPKALSFKAKSLDGKDVELAKYAGKVVLFVNVASKCGFTKQYESLQNLHDKYSADGLAIVGVPCNQFGGQEPGTEKEIAQFCKENYGVEFDMLAKVDVKGDEQFGLYKHLDSLDLKPAGKGPVKWNFEKFLVDRNGKPISRFGSKISPDSKQFVAAIESALAGGEMSSAASGAH